MKREEKQVESYTRKMLVYTICFDIAVHEKVVNKYLCQLQFEWLIEKYCTGGITSL